MCYGQCKVRIDEDRVGICFCKEMKHVLARVKSLKWKRSIV